MSERAWLIAGLVGGLALIAAGLVERGGPELPEGAAARVGGAVIGADELDRALAALAERRAIEPGLRHQVLARMIDEELLIQRGLELGLPVRDPQLRAMLSRAVIEQIVAEAELAIAAVPEAELRAFYAEHRGYFAASPRLRVRAGAFASEAEARRARAGRGPEEGRLVLGVPDALVPLPAIARALGDRVAAAAAELAPGQLSEPLAYADRWLLVRVEAHEPAAEPAFATMRQRVEAELRRRAGERALRAFLDARRAAARIEIAELAP